MSASRKKMLRREENTAAMSERQRNEMKEARKLRLYTVIFAVVLVLMIAVVICTTVVQSGFIERNTTALTVNDTKVSAVELNYFYVDYVNSYVSQYGDYLSMFGIDESMPLNEQYADEESGITWADSFLTSAISEAQGTYSLYLDAKANGYTLPEEAVGEIDATMENLAMYATMYGFSSTNSYIKAMYGTGSNESSLRDYMTKLYTAQYYYNDKQESLVYTDEELRTIEADKYNTYSSYTYDYFYLPIDSLLTGGTYDEETGETTYTDEEQAAAKESCKNLAETLAKNTSLEELNAMIAALADEKGLTTTSTTAATDLVYTSIETKIAEWLTAEDRQEGDIGYIENSYESTDEDGNQTTVVTGYYVIHYVSSTENNFPLVNARHILIKFEGGTTDDATGVVTYSAEEKATAYSQAQDILDMFNSGDGTEESFAELANEYSADTGSSTSGGLYEDIYPNEMVQAFNDWCFDESRQIGDTEIVETEYGYHIMYFVGQSDVTYRDYMITNELRTADISEWQNNLLSNTAVEEKDLSHVNMSMVLGSES